MREISRQKLNISFRIRAIDNFTKTHNKLHRQLTNIKRHVESIDDMKYVNVEVVGDMKAKRDLKKVERAAESANRKNVFIAVSTNAGDALKSFRKDMGYVATLSRDIGEVIGRTLTSALVTAGTTGVASIGALAGAIGAVGPMIGALAGGAFGLASALGFAGIAGAGFGAMAFPSIKKVFDANTKLKDLQEELGEATDEDERAAILKEMASVTDSLTSRQQKAMATVNSLGKTYKRLSDSIEPQSMYVFTHSVAMLEGLMTSLTPMIENAANAAKNLTDSLRLNLDAEDFKSFIGFLNTSAAPIMSDIFKGLGNFAMGLVNMMTAFGPASSVIAKGFNDMGRDFRTWADGLKESERFNSFIEFTLKEGPKVLSVFGGLTQGIVDMFAAFGPLASDMLDGLLDMVDGFKAWARALGDNKSFQEFTDWVRSHGPQLIDFFGRLRDFLINLGIGFAKVSETVTPFLTNMLDMFNTFMENNRWVGESVAWLVTLAGAIMSSGIIVRVFKFLLDVLTGAFKPLVDGVKTAFTWLSTKLLPIFTRLYLFFSQSVIPVLTKLWNVFLKAGPILGRVGGFLFRFISGPVGWVITGILTLMQIFDVSFTDIWNVTKKTFKKVADWVVEKVGLVVDTGKVVSDWIGDVIGFFGDMWDGVKESMGRIKDSVSNAWDDVLSFLSGINLYDIGANIISGMINGIKSMAGSLVDSAKGVVNGAISGAKKLLGINSPSRVFMEIGQGTGQGMINGLNNMRNKVANASDRMVGGTIPNARYNGGRAVTAQGSYNGGGHTTNSSDELLREQNGLLRALLQKDQSIYMDGREVGRIVEPEVSTVQARNTKTRTKFMSGRTASLTY